jgi:hypothetical protein
MRSEGKSVTGNMIIEDAKYLHDEMKITDKCIFSEAWLQNFKEPAAEGAIQMSYTSNSCTAKYRSSNKKLPVRT